MSVDRLGELEENLGRLRAVLSTQLREVPAKDGGGMVLVGLSGGELASLSREIRLLLAELASLDKGQSGSGVDELPGRSNPKGSNAAGRKSKPRRVGKGGRRALNGPGK